VNSPAQRAGLAGQLREAFGVRLQQDVPLAPYTSARIGGPADFLLVVRSSVELAATAKALWEMGASFRIIGAGSNVLVADAGVREVVLLNQARQMRFSDYETEPGVWVESGASLGVVARRAVERGWSGLEWAVTVPGTMGGAVAGNAGAHGSDMASCLLMAEILHQDGQAESWPVERLEYAYRDSWLKRHPGRAVVLSATIRLSLSTPEETKARAAEFVAQRQASQPPGARNPPGDYAGRLIEDAGLKGLRHGGAEISPLHANFFLNRGGATAADVWGLVKTVRDRVAGKSGVRLDLEIELLGDWPADVLEGGSESGGRG
jgi:UDP-N-acetylmuramate dehydrogenase